MREDYESEFVELVSASTDYLREECTKVIGHALAVCRPHDSFYWRGPGMLSPGVLGPVDLAALPRLVYGSPIDKQSVVEIWDELRDICKVHRPGDRPTAKQEREAAALVADSFPHLPVPDVAVPTLSSLARFLLACSWYQGTIEMRSTQNWRLRLGDGHLGLDENRMSSTFGGWSVSIGRLPLAYRLQTYVSVRLGKPRLCRVGTGALYRLLHDALPRLRVQIDALVCAAVTARQERTLQQAFEIQPIEEDDVAHFGPIWDAAMHLVERATINPSVEILTLLRAAGCSTKDVRLSRGEVYLETQRARHRRTLIEMREAISNRNGSQVDQDLANLIRLQEMIR